MKQIYPSKTKFHVFLFSFFLSLGIAAQTTSIPDVAFEQALIDLGIDSDQTINGQVLTADIPLCVKVDDEAMAAANTAPYDTWNVTGIDPAFYESGECVLAVNQVTQLKTTLYPNPTQNTFQIQTSERLETVNVYSITGREVASFTSQQKYDISYLSAGVYFVNVKSNRGERIQRLVKR